MRKISTDFETLRKCFDAQRRDTSQLVLSIAPTYACNCRCPYCYEQDKEVEHTVMDDRVEQAIYQFVYDCFAEQHFAQLEVQWYGGEPTLCMDIIERISQTLWCWCVEQGVSYSARMATNGQLVTPEVALLLANCGLQSAMLTLDGPREMHNARRPAADGGDSYQRVLDAVVNFKQAGVDCFCLMNVDKINAPYVAQVTDTLSQLGVVLMPAKLNDYSHTCNGPNCGAFCSPNFDLFTHEEYARFMFDQFKAQGCGAREFDDLLSPCSHFCTGQKNNYFVIDCFGDVYACDGWMGDKAHVVFNLLTDEPVLNAISFDPFQDEKCKSCKLLAICWGNCSWERERCGWPCHPLMYTMEDFCALCSE